MTTEEADGDDEVDNHGDQQQGRDEAEHQPPRVAALGLLPLEKLGVHSSKLAPNHRFGRALAHAGSAWPAPICEPFNGCGWRVGGCLLSTTEVRADPRPGYDPQPVILEPQKASEIRA